jgi:hypothetical protein
MSLRSSTRGLVLILCLAAGGCASNDANSRRMLDLNREALTAFEAGKYPRARELLAEAVAVGKKHGLTKHSAMARTYLDLGAVYLAMNEREKGMRSLGLALRLEPDIQPSAAVATPPVKKALSRVRTELEKRRGQASAKTQEQEKEKEKEPPAPPPARREPIVPPHAVVKATPAKPAKAPPPEKEKEKAPPPEPKPEPVVAKAAPPPPSADDEEPDLPASVPQSLYCPTPDEAPPASEIALRCVPRPGVSFGRMVLYYRSAGSETFTEVPMVRSHKGWYSGLVPASAVVGKSLQYYVEAQTPGKKVATTNGQYDSPNLMSIREGAARVGHGTLAAAHFKKDSPVTAEKEDDPLLETEREREREVALTTDHRRRPGKLYLGAGIGSGYGWHQRRVLEFRTEQAVAAGFSGGGLLQLTPELGYQYDERYAFALQSRHQFIPEEGSGDTKAGHPKGSAWAVLAHAYRFFGTGNGQVFVTGTLGGGQGFRLVVPPHPDQGVTRNDTVRGGPIILGPGLGYAYHFVQHFAWVTEVRLLAGLPDLATLAEFSTGGQLSF